MSFVSMGRFIIFSVITNIYNNRTKGPTLMELFIATGKLQSLLTTRDVRYVHQGWQAHIDMIFKFLPHTRENGCIDILLCCNDPC
jgi:hypothetical protein